MHATEPKPRCVHGAGRSPRAELGPATAWRWSEPVRVFAHQTARSLHGRSDVLPALVQRMLRQAWRPRRAPAARSATSGPSRSAWTTTKPRSSGAECSATRFGFAPSASSRANSTVSRSASMSRSAIRSRASGTSWSRRKCSPSPASPCRRRGTARSRRTSPRSCTRTRCRARNNGNRAKGNDTCACRSRPGLRHGPESQSTMHVLRRRAGVGGRRARCRCDAAVAEAHGAAAPIERRHMP